MQAQQQQQPSPGAAPAAAAACAVHIEGNNTGHIVKATVACSGGSITVGADNSTVRSVLQQNSTGVTWRADTCGLQNRTCVLAICGVQGGGLLDLHLTVTNYFDSTVYLWGVVCIAGNTRALLKVGSRDVG